MLSLHFETTMHFYIQLANEQKLPLSEVFLQQEVQESGKPRDILREHMRQRILIMEKSIAEGITAPQHSKSGYIKGGAYQLNQWQSQNRSLLGTGFGRLLVNAIAVPEVNACMGKIVAAPTAGSCGVLPAVIFTIANEWNIEAEPVINAFFTAGGIGMVIEKNATLSGAQGGCQAEIGSASAMAAGAVVEMMGGTPEQVDHAVAFALKNLLGLICDPVGGLVEIPCVKRNALGAVNAVAAAEMALAGLDSIFTADQVIETMGRVGKKIPEEFRETAAGGLAGLPRP